MNGPFAIFTPLAVALAVAFSPAPAAAQDRAAFAMGKNDKNGDGKVTREEWSGRPEIFDSLDLNKDGALTIDEFRARFAGNAPPPKLQGDLISPRQIDAYTAGAFGSRKNKVRENGIARGLAETGLVPVYPDAARCNKIDHVFGETWQGPEEALHSGADIPGAWDEPVHAMADGEVVAKFAGKRGYRGLQLVLRHGPEQTGYPVWIYTLYSHFNKEPKWEVGQKVKQGDYLGPNGKSGVPGKYRAPHVHLSVYMSASPRYARTDELLIPENGYFIDPVALFRGKLPLETHAAKALPENEKRVPIAYQLTSGEVVPAGAKIIWPFRCEPK